MYIDKIENKKQELGRGFTLIELLVSLALFSIFLVAVMGAIFSIIDTNKKARSLMSVMNNLSFSIDGMTRSFKTGTGPSITSDGKCFTTSQLNYGNTNFSIDRIKREDVTYCFEEEPDGRGKMTRKIYDKAAYNQSVTVDYTSKDIDIDYLKFQLTGEGTGDGSQPRLLINLAGTVRVSERISSEFSIQTSVSQANIDS